MTSAALAAREPLAAPAAAPARGPWLKIVLPIWLLLTLLLIAVNFQSIAARQFHDPDDELRLVQVRDLLAGQGWYDLHQYRINAADGGVPMHWSRIVDVPIAAVILIARPLVGQASAELIACVLVPALTALACLLAVGWMARRLFDPEKTAMACLAFALSAMAMVQMLPMRIDHHGWQIFAALLALCGLLVTDERRGGWLTGFAMALWMGISFEGLPLSAAIVGVLALDWLNDGKPSARLLATVQSLALCALAIFAATRGTADLIQHCDAISPVHLAVFVWGAVVLTLSARAGLKSRAAIGGAIALAGAGAFGLLFALAPQCAAGNFNELDPVVRSTWFDMIPEGLPVFHAEAGVMAQYLLPPLVGLYSAWQLYRRSDGAARTFWLRYTLILAASLALGIMVIRACSAACALAALPIGWRLSTWLSGMKRPADPVKRLAELALVAGAIFGTLLPAAPVTAVQTVYARVTHKPTLNSAAASKAESACNIPGAAPALARLPGGDVLTPVDIGPRILLNTPRGVLGTSHHRGNAGIRGVIDAFTGSPETARAVMTRHNLRFVALCPGVDEIAIYKGRAADGLAARLDAGRAPAWLRPVPMPQGVGLKVWQRVD